MKARLSVFRCKHGPPQQRGPRRRVLRSIIQRASDKQILLHFFTFFHQKIIHRKAGLFTD